MSILIDIDYHRTHIYGNTNRKNRARSTTWVKNPAWLHERWAMRVVTWQFPSHPGFSQASLPWPGGTGTTAKWQAIEHLVKCRLVITSLNRYSGRYFFCCVQLTQQVWFYQPDRKITSPTSQLSGGQVLTKYFKLVNLSYPCERCVKMV